VNKAAFPTIKNFTETLH
jgi:alpha-glucosidase (family GH31 glycosyl hydrolase)